MYEDDLLAVVPDLREKARLYYEQLADATLTDIDNPEGTPEEIYEALTTRLNRLGRRCDQYTEGSPSSFPTMIEHLQRAWDHLDIARDQHFALATTRLSHWREGVAVSVRDEYLGQLGSHADVQLGYLEELGRALKAVEKLFRETRDHALALGQCAKDTAFTGPHGSADVLALMGVVLTALSLTPIPAAGLTAARTVVGLIGLASNGSPERETIELDGVTPIQRLEDTLDRFTALGRAVHDAEDKISEGLRADLDRFEGLVGLYHDLRSVTNLGGASPVPPDRAELAVNIADLHTAGYVYFSAAAYEYDQALRAINDATELENTAFGFGSVYDNVVGYSRSEYEQARDQLVLALTRTRDDLVATGDRLVEIALNHARNEADSTAIMTKIDEFVAEVDDSVYTMHDFENGVPQPAPA